MKVLYLIDKLDPGGSQRHLLRLIRHLAAQGVTTRVVCSEAPGAWAGQLIQQQIEVDSLEAPQLLSWDGWRALRQLAAMLREWEPDVLHTLLFDANVLGPVAAWWAKFDGAVIASRRDTGFALKSRQVSALQYANRCVTRLVANSPATRDARAKLEGIPENRWTVIGNGVDLDTLESGKSVREMFRAADDAFVILCVARLRKEKGQATVIRALAQLRSDIPKAELWLVGDGPEEGKLKALATELHLERQVRFLGHRDEVENLYASADVAVLVSDHEGFSNVLLEAMGAGVPVVASDVEGNSNLIENGKTGLLVPSRDAGKLAGAILALTQSSGLKSSLVKAARELVRTRYSPEVEAEAYLALYGDALKSKGKA